MKKRFRICPYVFLCLLTVSVFIFATAIGSQVHFTFSEQNALDDRVCIVIDAGHGGEDGGATSCTGILESTINLQIAIRVNDFMHLLGYNTVMIRTTDASVCTQGKTIAQRKVSDLKKRVEIVNTTENALLISIHQNQFSDSRYSGAQVFYANTSGSDLLARSMQSTFVSTLNPGSNRKSKRSTGIYLMDHIQCTGVLIECGFISNPLEEEKLRSDNYQKHLSAAIGCAVSVFLDQPAAS